MTNWQKAQVYMAASEIVEGGIGMCAAVVHALYPRGWSDGGWDSTTDMLRRDYTRLTGQPWKVDWSGYLVGMTTRKRVAVLRHMAEIFARKAERRR